jgi:hypothetical protein
MKMANTDSKSETLRELKKAQEAIALVPKVGRITLLTRRFFNALLHMAQETGNQPTYRRRLSDVLGRASFDSNNTEVAKEQIRRMVGIQVEWNSVGDEERRWGVSSLLSDVEIIEQSGGVWIEWSYGEKVRGKLLDPEIYARISLQAYSHLRSSASAALYEICVRYVTSPTGLTLRAAWQWWRPRLTGNPEDLQSETEYKIFKRDVLKPAISEVNSLTDIMVELIEHKAGRKIGEIQFKAVRENQNQLDLPNPNLVNSDLIQRMVDLIGMQKNLAAQLYSDHEEELLLSTIDLTLQRDADKSLPPLRSRAAYFKDAIRGKYAKSAVKKQQLQTSAAPIPLPSNVQPQEVVADPAREAAMAAFEKLPIADQKRRLELFAETLAAPLRQKFVSEGLGSVLVRKALEAWLANGRTQA